VQLLSRETLQRDFEELPRNEGRKLLRQLREMLFSENVPVQLKYNLRSFALTTDLMHSHPFRIDYDLDGRVGINISAFPDILLDKVLLKESDFLRQLALVAPEREASTPPAQAFREFLEKKMRADEWNKKEYWWSIARKHPFGIAGTTFTKVWKQANENTGCGWDRGGRPQKP
jgi:hypothetical protein